MKRRGLLIGIAGAAAAWPLGVRAQTNKTRRIGVVMGALLSDDKAAQNELKGFRKGLAEHGWTEGNNIELILRWSGGDIDLVNKHAQEIVALQPDVLIARSTPITAALKAQTQRIPIVFVQVSEPISSGFVKSLARPDGNITGFTNFESSIGSKWLELLRDISPQTKRVMIIFNPTTAPYHQLFISSAEAAGRDLGIEVGAAPVLNDADIKTTFEKSGATPGGGIVQLADSFLLQRYELLVALAAAHRVPVIYSYRQVPANGGLIAYAVDTPDLFFRAAAYVDRLLKGARPEDLPVQQPTKFELIINLKTAKELGLSIPQNLMVRADEVIE